MSTIDLAKPPPGLPAGPPGPPSPPEPAGAGRRRRRWILPLSPWHLVLLPATVVLIFPFFWMVVTSLETSAEALRFPPDLTPHVLRFANYADALRAEPFGRFFWNSTVVALTTVTSNLALCAAAGYAFARFRFLGRGLLFVLIMTTLMVPFQVTMIPQFLIVKWIGVNLLAGAGVGHIGSLIVPNAATAFGVFFLRQFFRTLPIEYEEAARVDGACGLGGAARALAVRPRLAVTALLAAVCMVVQDVLATLLVQAEARNRAGLAAAFDAAMWCFGIATTSIAVTALQGHSLGEKVMVVGAVTAANVAGSFAGVKIGKRFITEDPTGGGPPPPVPPGRP